MSPEPSNPVTSIDYAPAEPVRRRKRLRRLVTVVAVLSVAAVAAWRGPALWRWAQAAYVVRQCQSFSFPKDFVVYDDATAPAGSTFVRRATPVPADGLVPFARVPTPADPAPFLRLAQVAEGGPGYFTLFAPRGSGPEPLVFLHERTTTGGRRRIVAVRASGLSEHPGSRLLSLTYSAALVDWRGGKALPESLTRAWGGVDVSNPGNPQRVLPKQPPAKGVRLFAGRPDPGDRSAFVIPYEVNGTRHEFRFKLVDEANRTGLELEDQPAPPPAP